MLICRLSEVQPLEHTLKHATSLEDEAESQTLPLHTQPNYVRLVL